MCAQTGRGLLQLRVVGVCPFNCCLREADKTVRACRWITGIAAFRAKAKKTIGELKSLSHPPSPSEAR